MANLLEKYGNDPSLQSWMNSWQNLDPRGTQPSQAYRGNGFSVTPMYSDETGMNAGFRSWQGEPNGGDRLSPTPWDAWQADGSYSGQSGVDQFKEQPWWQDIAGIGSILAMPFAAGALGAGAGAADAGATGMWGESLAGGLGDGAGLGTQLGIDGAGGSGLATAADGVMPPNPYNSGNGLNPTNILDKLKSTGTNMGVSQILQSLGGNGGGGGTGTPDGNGGLFGGSGGIGNLLGLLGAAYGGNQQKQASGDMLNWLNGQQAKVDNLYKPGSPEYNYLWDEMSRKDASAGRNSQYGPRSVDLAAKIAQIKADSTARMTTGIGNTYAAALNSGANAYAGIPAMLGNMTGANGALSGGMNSFITQIGKLLGGSGGTSLGSLMNSGGAIGTANAMSDNYNGADWSQLGSGGTNYEDLFGSI